MASNSGFTALDSGWILGGSCNLRAVPGPIDWVDVNSSYEGRVTLTADGVDDPLDLRYRIPKKKADQPSLSLTYRSRNMYRLDVNGNHREQGKLIPYSTHLHRARSDDDVTYDPSPLGVPQIPLGQRVTPAQYRAILNAFAAPIGLDLIDLTWTDPDEGRQP